MSRDRAEAGEWVSQFPTLTPALSPAPSPREAYLGQTGTAAPPPRQPRWRSTHGIEEHSEEELSPVDDLVQFTGATRVLAVEDGVCEEAAGLPREDLGMETERSSGTSRHGWRREDPSLRAARVFIICLLP